MTEQLSLAPEKPVQFRDGMVPLARIVDDVSALPLPESFYKSVKRHGVLQPVVLASAEPDEEGPRWRLIFGRRRVAAARKARMQSIPARVALNLDSWHGDAVLALVENAQRSPNPVNQLLAIRKLQEAGKTDREIMRATGLNPQEFKRVVALRTLARPLLVALAKGQIRPSVGFAAAKLSEPLQAQLAERLEARKNKKLTLKDVRAVTEAVRSEARAELPAALFETPASVEADEGQVYLVSLHQLGYGATISMRPDEYVFFSTDVADYRGTFSVDELFRILKPHLTREAKSAEQLTSPAPI